MIGRCLNTSCTFRSAGRYVAFSEGEDADEAADGSFPQLLMEGSSRQSMILRCFPPKNWIKLVIPLDFQALKLGLGSVRPPKHFEIWLAAQFVIQTLSGEFQAGGRHYVSKGYKWLLKCYCMFIYYVLT